MLESLLFFSTISLIKLSILVERVFSFLRSDFVCHVECAANLCIVSPRDGWQNAFMVEILTYFLITFHSDVYFAQIIINVESGFNLE